ncbi:MAG: topoisomerase protein [Candidatus Saccharibacteria bacterium GW2011_GWA2_46_10]|nr:MAG: topoisomerase protein [Candidatus Saccharibacteria bacterium GW2011_GWA2_46_10]OGL34961.1 MAG: DNA topoisomerase I [Candidatus Saccharibacteria bacterium RIFCSPHIGHO2_12_FULL_47_17]
MPKNVVIVESPAKAKTIARFLGKEYEVTSSYGHIRDLPKKEFGVDIEKGFKPTYVVPPDKKKAVRQLKQAAKGATIWLASDEDREGEAIAWHVCELLGLNPDSVKRIVFHEITEGAISQAIKTPRGINRQLVDAQQARRVLDRLVGYELSPVLWKKVRPGLSAGRVQSVAVRLIVEREREIRAFEPESSFKLTAVFVVDEQQLTAEAVDKIAALADARAFLENLKSATFKVIAIDQKPASRSPSAPFTTSTLQQAASSRLGFSVRQTMRLAQQLYEDGLITYMRTDSVILAETALNSTAKYINGSFGAKYYHRRQYQTKSRSAQEAHEAIRPTDINKTSAGRDGRQRKLYELIWRRTVASQMAAAEIEKTQVKIAISTRDELLIASGEVLKFDGFMKVYGGAKDDQLLPNVKVGDSLQLAKATATENFSRPPSRYSEATLVKKLEELGIGRPSTYAPTISTIQDRGYIEKRDSDGTAVSPQELNLDNGQISPATLEVIIGADKNKLAPTDLAEVVTDFLIKYFTSIVDYDFTARAEAQFDDIANGGQDWQKMIAAFYETLHPLIKKSQQVSRAEAAGARELGKDPASGKPVIVRYARFGPVLQLGQSPDPKDKTAPKPQFAPLPADTTMDNVTLEAALPMFNLPRAVGQTEQGESISASIGPYGPYIKVGKKFISLKEHDPLAISEAEARVLIKEQAEVASKKVIADFGVVKVLNGPYGPYVTDGKINARLPKKQDPDKIDEQTAKKILENKPKAKFKRKRS